MARSNRPARKALSPRLRIYCLGPGFGESIVLHLPCGSWGVVDCYHGARGGTVDFLRQMGVERLKFFCLTHPHQDHYRGAHRLFDHYTRKIEEVWRFPWYIVKDLRDLEDATRDLRNLAHATDFRDKYLGDPEAEEIADDYKKMVAGFVRERERLTGRTYRHIMGYNQLIDEEHYQVDVRGPDAATVEKFQQSFGKIVIKTAPDLLSDEGGELINSISVVLMITFGTAKIFLLGDAQDSKAKLDDDEKEIYTLVKIAHHGSPNGRAAEFLTTKGRGRRMDHALLTPYRSVLPCEIMKGKYTNACIRLVQTRQIAPQRPRQTVPTMTNPRVIDDTANWIGIEVFKSGKIEQFQ